MTGTLWIDTSSDHSFIAFGEVIVFFKKSKDLVSEIKRFLPSPHMIKEIRVGCGPGLFTGTRIGVMVAQSLHFAQQIPLFGFCSLMRHAPLEEGPFFTFSDAKSRGFYLLEGKLENGLLSYGDLVLLESLPQGRTPLKTPPTIEHLKNIPYSPKIEVVY